MNASHTISFQINALLSSQFASVIHSAQNQLQGLAEQATRATLRAQDAQFATLELGSQNLSSLQAKMEAFKSTQEKIAELQAQKSQKSDDVNRLRNQYQRQSADVENYKQNLQHLKDVFNQVRSTLSAEQRNIWQEQIRQASEELRSHQDALRATGRELANAEREVSRLNNQLNRQQQELQELQAALESGGIDLEHFTEEQARLQDEINRTNEALEEQTRLAQARERVEAAQNNFDQATGNLQNAIGSAREMFAPVMDSVMTYAGFDAVMSEVQAITGASDESLDQLTAKARELGATTTFKASEAAKAMTYLGLAGWKTDQILAGLPDTLSLAQAGGTDLATTADIVSDGLTAMNMSANEAGRFADVMAATMSNANTDVGMMGETFKYAASVAGSLGYSIEDVALATGLMANAGTKGSMAGTALRSTFTRLIDPPKEAAMALDKLGFSAVDSNGKVKPFRQTLTELRGKFKNLTEAEKATYASTIAGQEAMAGFLALMNASDADFNKLSNAIDNSKGKASEMAAIMTDNLEGSMAAFESATESVQISAGKIFEPLVRQAFDFGTSMAQSVDQFIQKNPEAVQSAAKVAAAISAISIASAGFQVASAGVELLSAQYGFLVERLGRARRAVAEFFAAHTGLTSAGGAIEAIKASWQALKTRVIAARTAVVSFWATNTASSMASSAVTALQALGAGFLNAARAALAFAFSPVGIALMVIGAAGLFAYQNWDKVAPIFSNLASVLGGTLQAAIASLTPAFASLGTTADRLGPAFSIIGQAAFTAFAIVLNVVVRTAAMIITAFSNAVKTVTELFSGLGGALASLLAGDFSGAASQLVDTASQAVSNIKNAWSQGVGDLGNIIDTTIKMPNEVDVAMRYGDIGQNQVLKQAPISSPMFDDAMMNPTQIDTSQAQQQINDAGQAANQFSQSVQTATETQNQAVQNQTSQNDILSQFTQAVQPASTEFNNLTTSTTATTAEFTNLTTSTTAANAEFTNLTTSTNATSSSMQSLQTAASSAGTSLSSLDSAVSSVASSLRSKAAEISSIKITVPQISASPVAKNAEGGIYPKGAFLTTFAEESPEAAIPIDKSKRAVDLWTKTGQMLGQIPGKAELSTVERARQNRVETVLKQAEQAGVKTINNGQFRIDNASSVQKQVEEIDKQKRLEEAIKYLPPTESNQRVLEQVQGRKYTPLTEKVRRSRSGRAIAKANANEQFRNNNGQFSSNILSSSTNKNIEMLDGIINKNQSNISQNNSTSLWENISSILPKSSSNLLNSTTNKNIEMLDGIINKNSNVSQNKSTSLWENISSILPKSSSNLLNSTTNKNIEMLDGIINKNQSNISQNKTTSLWENISSILPNKAGNLLTSLQNIFQGDNKNSLEGLTKNLFTEQNQMPQINISITIQGNADEQVMQKAGQEMQINLERELDKYFAEKNRNSLRSAF